jgi:hypothetical protein
VNRFEVYAYIGNQTHENKGRAVKCFSIVKFHLQRAKKKDDFIRCSLLAFCFSAGWVSTYTRHNTSQERLQRHLWNQLLADWLAVT